MKVSQMNAHEKMAYRMVCETMSEYIGGNENVLLDYEKDSEEYMDAWDYLHSGREALAEDIYTAVMMESDKGILKHLRFAGKDFIMERINKRLEKWGY